MNTFIHTHTPFKNSTSFLGRIQRVVKGGGVGVGNTLHYQKKRGYGCFVSKGEMGSIRKMKK